MANQIIQTDPSLQRRRQLAMQMMQSGQNQPVQHWTQGASNILNAYLGARELKKTEEEEARQRELGQGSLDLALQELSSPQQEPMMTEMGTPVQLGIEEPTGTPMNRFAQVLAQNPYTRDFAAQLQLQQAQQQPQMRMKQQQAEQTRQAELQSAKDLAEFKAQLGQKYPKPESEFDKYLKMLQAQKTEADISKKQMEMQQAEKLKSQEQYNVQNAADLVSELKTHPGFTSIYGGVQGITPTVRQSSVDAEAIRDQLLNVMTLAARGQLKGQGQITERETEMLSRAQSMLSNPRISDDAAIKEADKVLNYLQSLGANVDTGMQGEKIGRRSGRSDLRQSAPSQPQTQEDFDALESGSLYIDPDDGFIYRKP